MPMVLAILAVSVVALVLYNMQRGDGTSEISYGFFLEQLNAKPCNIAKLDLENLKGTGEFKEPPLDPKAKAEGKTNRKGEPIKLEKKFTTTLPVIFDQTGGLDRLLSSKLGDKYNVVAPTDSTYMLYIISTFALPVLIIAALFIMFRRTRDSIFGGGGILGFSKSPRGSTSWEIAASPSPTWPGWKESSRTCRRSSSTSRTPRSSSDWAAACPRASC